MIIKEQQDEIQSYLEDASNVRNGKADKVYIPDSEADIVALVKECSAAKEFLTVSGGGTGTVGGRVPRIGSQISLERFNTIHTIVPRTKTASLQAGVVIRDFLKALDENGLFYPPFPTERSAFIGGNISTNASGEYSFRFGATRRYVKKINIVLSTGEILELERGATRENGGIIPVGPYRIPLPSYRTPPIKCTAGYYSQPGMDPIDLFIGAEGTLGIVTSATVETVEHLPPRFILIIFLPDDSRIMELVSLIKGRKDLDTCSLEYFCPGSLAFLKKDFAEIPDNAFGIYVEAKADTTQMEEWLALAEKFDAVDAVIGEDPKNYERLIDFRHKLPENVNACFRALGITKVAMDIAVPEEKFTEIYAYYRAVMKAESIHTILFGHIGENHLHFNFFPKNEAEKERAYELYRQSAIKALSFGGTIAAEHGIGKIKHQWLSLMYGEKGIHEMALIKKILDPAGILGPDNIFPRSLRG